MAMVVRSAEEPFHDPDDPRSFEERARADHELVAALERILAHSEATPVFPIP